MRLEFELNDSIGAVGAALRERLAGFIGETANKIGDNAKAALFGTRTGLTKHGHAFSLPGEAPADPHGAIADSISVRQDGLQAEVAVGAPFAPFLELGTSKMAPRPFLLPAAQSEFDKVNGELRSLIED